MRTYAACPWPTRRRTLNRDLDLILRGIRSRGAPELPRTAFTRHGPYGRLRVRVLVMSCRGSLSGGVAHIGGGYLLSAGPGGRCDDRSRAHRNLERQLRHRPAAPAARLAGGDRARCRLPAGDEVADFPADEVGALGYEVATHGDGRWNGVAILSRVGLDDVAAGFAGEPGFPPRRRGRSAPPAPASDSGRSTCPTAASRAHPHYAYKLAWLAALRDHIAAEAAGHPFAVLGDFNVAPTDEDVWDPAAFRGLDNM